MASNWEQYVAAQMQGLGLATGPAMIPAPPPPPVTTTPSQIPFDLLVQLAGLAPAPKTPAPKPVPMTANKRKERDPNEPLPVDPIAVQQLRQTPEYATAVSMGMSDTDAIGYVLQAQFAQQQAAPPPQEQPSVLGRVADAATGTVNAVGDVIGAAVSPVIDKGGEMAGEVKDFTGDFAEAPLSTAGTILAAPITAISGAVQGDVPPKPELTPQEQKIEEQQAIDLDQWERVIKPQYEQEWPQERIQAEREQANATLATLNGIAAIQLSPDDQGLGSDILNQQIADTQTYIEQLDAIEAAVYGTPEPDQPRWRRVVGKVMGFGPIKWATTEMARPGQWTRQQIGGALIHTLANGPEGLAPFLQMVSTAIPGGLPQKFSSNFAMMASLPKEDLNQAYQDGGDAGVWEYAIGEVTKDMSPLDAIIFKGTMDTVLDPLNWVPVGAEMAAGTKVGTAFRAADVATNIPGEIVIGGVRLGYRGAKGLPLLGKGLAPGEGAVIREVGETAGELAPRLEANLPDTSIITETGTGVPASPPRAETPQLLRPAYSDNTPFNNTDYTEFLNRTKAGESPNAVIESIWIRRDNPVTEGITTATVPTSAETGPVTTVTDAITTLPRATRENPLADLAQGIEPPRRVGQSTLPRAAEEAPFPVAAESVLPRPNYLTAGRGAFSDEDYARYLDEAGRLADNTPGARDDLIRQIDQDRLRVQQEATGTVELPRAAADQPGTGTTAPVVSTETATRAELPRAAESSTFPGVRQAQQIEPDNRLLWDSRDSRRTEPLGTNAGVHAWRQQAEAVRVLIQNNMPIRLQRLPKGFAIDMQQTEDLIWRYIVESDNKTANAIRDRLGRSGFNSWQASDGTWYRQPAGASFQHQAGNREYITATRIGNGPGPETVQISRSVFTGNRDYRLHLPDGADESVRIKNRGGLGDTASSDDLKDVLRSLDESRKSYQQLVREGKAPASDARVVAPDAAQTTSAGANFVPTPRAGLGKLENVGTTTLDRIKTDVAKYQPRKDPAAAATIARIKADFRPNELGLIDVADNGDGTFTVLSGHSRIHAITELQAEGRLPKDFQIPVKVVEGTPEELVDYAWASNNATPLTLSERGGDIRRQVEKGRTLKQANPADSEVRSQGLLDLTYLPEALQKAVDKDTGLFSAMSGLGEMIRTGKVGPEGARKFYDDWILSGEYTGPQVAEQLRMLNQALGQGGVFQQGGGLFGGMLLESDTFLQAQKAIGALQKQRAELTRIRNHYRGVKKAGETFVADETGKLRSVDNAIADAQSQIDEINRKLNGDVKGWFGEDLSVAPPPAKKSPDSLGFANLIDNDPHAQAAVQWAKDVYARLAGTAPEHIPVEQAVKVQELVDGSFVEDLARYGRIGERDRQWLNTKVDVRNIRWQHMTPQARKQALEVLGIDIGSRTKAAEIKDFVDSVWAVGDPALPTRGDLYKEILTKLDGITPEGRLKLWQELIGGVPEPPGTIGKYVHGMGRMARDAIMFGLARAIPNSVQDLATNMFVSLVEGQPGVTRLHAEIMKDVFQDSRAAGSKVGRAIGLDGGVRTGPFRNASEELNTFARALDVHAPATVDSMFGARFDEITGNFVEDSRTWWSRNFGRLGKPGERIGSLIGSPTVKFLRNAQDDAARRAAWGDYLLRNFKQKQDEFYDGIRALADAHPGQFDPDDVIRRLENSGQVIYEQHAFSPDDVRAAFGFNKYGDKLARDWRKALDELNRGGAENTNKLYFSYRQTWADEKLGGPFMFHYWMTRASVQHARLALENPNLMALYIRTWEGMKRQDQEGVPTWAKMYTGLMAGPYGMMGFISPAAVLVGLATVLDANDVGSDPSFANTLRVFPFHPLVQVAASIFLDERASDPTGTNHTRNFWKAAANYLVNEMGVSSPALIGDPVADLNYRLTELARGILADADVPFVKAMTAPSPRQRDTQIVKYYAADYMQNTPDPVNGGTLWQNPDGSITDQASQVMANIDAGLYAGDIEKEALRRYSVDLMAGRVAMGTFPVPIQTIYPTVMGQAREDRKAGIAGENMPLQLDQTSTPDNMQFIDPSHPMTTSQAGATLAVEQADAGSAQSGKLLASINQYNAIGSEYMQETSKEYNELAYSDAAVLQKIYGGQGATLAGEFVSWELWGMLPPSARRIYLDAHLKETGDWGDYQSYLADRETFVTSHPEIAGFKDWQRAVGEKGGDSMLSELLSGNYPAFDAWWNTQSVSPAKVTSVLMTPSAYLAANGYEPNLWDVNDISRKPTVANQNPLSQLTGDGSNTGYASTKPFSALTGPEKVQRIYERAAVYQAQMDQFNRVASPYLGQWTLDDLGPAQRQIVLILLENKGIKPPKPSSILTDYQTWAARQPRGADNSVEAYVQVLESVGVTPVGDDEDLAA